MGTKQSVMIKHWDEEAAALPAEKIGMSVPVYVLLGEAVDAAKFHGRYSRRRNVPMSFSAWSRAEDVPILRGRRYGACAHRRCSLSAAKTSTCSR